MLVSELVFRILAEIAPDRVPADSGAMPTWQFYVNGFRRNGEGFALHQHAFGGQGGRPGADGLPAVSFPYNVRNVSVEWSETETPILFERRELIACDPSPAFPPSFRDLTGRVHRELQLPAGGVPSHLRQVREVGGGASAVEEMQPPLYPGLQGVADHRPQWSDPGAAGNEQKLPLHRVGRKNERAERPLDRKPRAAP